MDCFNVDLNFTEKKKSLVADPCKISQYAICSIVEPQYEHQHWGEMTPERSLSQSASSLCWPRWITVLSAFLLFFSASSLSKAGTIKKKNLHHQDLLSVSCPDKNNGWACGRLGTILHTADGGRTWSKQHSESQYTLSSVSFVDSKKGWVVGDGGTILATQDGGKSWKKQKSPVDHYLFGVDFVSPNEGWIVSGNTTILHTVDGGKTWSVQHTGEDFHLKAVSFCDSLHGWAVGEYGFIYGTADGGAIWTRQAGRYGISEETGDIDAETILFDVQAVDPEIAWV